MVNEKNKKCPSSNKASIEYLLIAIEKGENLDLINNRLTEKKDELTKVETLLIKEKNKINSITEEKIRFFLNCLKNGDINDMEYRLLFKGFYIINGDSA